MAAGLPAFIVRLGGIHLEPTFALFKALTTSGMMLLPGGSIFLSIADRNKPEAVPMI